MSAPEPCLVLDGSARAGVRVGVLSGGRWVGQGLSPDGALEGLFGCVEAALVDAKLSLGDIRSFALCVGPGSVLGIRIAALAVRAWSALEPDGVVPDIQIFGKGIAGGYAPLAAVVASARITDTLAAGSGGLNHAQTFSHHAVSCAAGTAAMRRRNVWLAPSGTNGAAKASPGRRAATMALDSKA